MSKISRSLSFALTGWVAGALGSIILGFSWPIFFPAIINVENYYGDGPGLFAIIGLSLLVMTPFSLIGGLLGSRVAIEGGEFSQRAIAAIFAIVFTIPCSCGVLLFFTGFGFGLA